jgi:hypothetical protein
MCVLLDSGSSALAQQGAAFDPSDASGYAISDDPSGEESWNNDHAATFAPWCGDDPPCGSCPPCDPCHHERHCSGWFGAEWLHWRLDGNRLPPLVTDGPVTAPPNMVARLDDPATRILSGDEEVNEEWREGYRLFGGVWLDHCRTLGIGGDYFDLSDDDYRFFAGPDPTRVVGRPFFNAELGIEDVEFVSVPSELDGTVTVDSSDDFRGAGITLNQRLCRWCDPCCAQRGSQLSILSGYRWYEYDSDLSITENLTVLPNTTTPLVPGTTIFVEEQFRTENEFHGGEIGLQAVDKHCWWWLDGMAKVAMGRLSRTVVVDGQTIVNVPGGGTAINTGGLLTSQVTNIGRYDDSEFVLIPEFRLGAGARATRHCTVRAGYNVLIWPEVARAASHLPPGLEVDPRNLPPVIAGGGPEPEFPGIRGSELVAHGFDFTVAWQY